MRTLKRRKRKSKKKRSQPIEKRRVGCHGAVILHNNKMRAEKKRGD